MNIKKKEFEQNLFIAEQRYKEAFELLRDGHVDLDQADEVEIVYAKHNDGWRLWINVNGQNRFRAYRITRLHLQVEPDE